MQVHQAILLGLLQGLTEYLPVSSSGHLVLLQQRWQVELEQQVFFDVLLHFGTLLAVVVYYRGRLLDIALSVLPGAEPSGAGEGAASFSGSSLRRDAGLIVLATAATVAVVLLMNAFLEIEELFHDSRRASVMLLVTATLMAGAHFASRMPARRPGIGIADSLLLGLVQGVAILPGLSRSGSMIAVALFRRAEREKAIDFVFVLSIPAILGAVVWHLPDIGGIESRLWPAFLLGFLAAFAGGLLAIAVFLAAVKRRVFLPFAGYCAVLGALVLVMG